MNINLEDIESLDDRRFDIIKEDPEEQKEEVLTQISP